MMIRQKNLRGAQQGAQAVGHEKRAGISFSALGCHSQGEEASQGGSAALPSSQGLSPILQTVLPDGIIWAYCATQHLGSHLQGKLRGPPCSQLQSPVVPTPFGTQGVPCPDGPPSRGPSSSPFALR